MHSTQHRFKNYQTQFFDGFRSPSSNIRTQEIQIFLDFTLENILMKIIHFNTEE